MRFRRKGQGSRAVRKSDEGRPLFHAPGQYNPMSIVLDPKTVHSILVIKLRAVGDVLLSTVVTPNLRRAFPGVRMDFLTEPASVDILSGNPFIDETIVFDSAVTSGIGLIRKIRQRRYDLVIDLFGNPRTALVTRL